MHSIRRHRIREYPKPARGGKRLASASGKCRIRAESEKPCDSTGSGMAGFIAPVTFEPDTKFRSSFALKGGDGMQINTG